MDIKEERIRAITQFYYSKPEVQEAILKFAKNREVVPSYMMQSFGKRPDMLQYNSDIKNLVKRGATSFHSSEELWENPLNLSSELTRKEMDSLRKGWDLIIDVDSKYLDVSKILAKLILDALESNEIKNYGVKFSGSKGFHIIVPEKAFPKEFDGRKTKDMFPEWPRAICQYLMHTTRREFNRRLGNIFEGSATTSGAKEALCPNCGRPTKKGTLIILRCPVCQIEITRKDMKETKKRLKCVQENCAGVLEVTDKKDYFQCFYCENVSTINKKESSGRYSTVFTEYASKSEDYSGEIKEEHAGISYGAADLVLVAPRHLFRMPYSLHEKTALASVVISADEIESFRPIDANPLQIKIRNFLPDNIENEARRLLSEALEWKGAQELIDKKIEEGNYKKTEYAEVNPNDITEEMFPPAIKKLLNGLEDGRKRGLFVLITFLRSLNFSPEYINKKVKEWNEKNSPPLREGYVKSQIEWHLKQKRKILPPNYSNDNFYRDLGLISEKPKTKNPIVDVLRKIRKNTD